MQQALALNLCLSSRFVGPAGWQTAAEPAGPTCREEEEERKGADGARKHGERGGPELNKTPAPTFFVVGSAVCLARPKLCKRTFDGPRKAGAGDE
eukprot:CAMPEP_0206460316 /NCGR_PEP_ID=MMETSP0324_2-20121206/24688_1 /ASSEMBLY_ACC=CAM_ASM_000836 /TAXON_ID=2866 /ORGANISM="Crypthecodinium cohnii, Strain Seligo" /LENGTH=94 /DNA_ID=CAMNT_0053932013 /DNA_START=167 /DNA_END=448 /DNA_ORIENTATION=-